MSINYYLLFLNGFLKASDTAFSIFQTEITGNDLESAQVSLKRFTRGIHGARETLKNWREAHLDPEASGGAE